MSVVESKTPNNSSSPSTATVEAVAPLFWFSEMQTESLRVELALTSITFNAQSPFQKIQLIETVPYGKTLVLDGKTQSALTDEFVYHETLVHPAMLAHPCPKIVYIGGGGEFGTAREVLKHASVEKVIMVDIDQMVCDICREHLPEWNQGVFEDPRLEVHYEDAHAFLERYTGPAFDVIIMDIADPIEAGPGYVLYTQEFYTYAQTKMTSQGVMVTQSGPGSINNADECFTAIYQTLRTSFNTVLPYTVNIPSFASDWAFTMAFNVADEEVASAVTRVSEQSTEVTNQALSARLGKYASSLRSYDGISHRGSFGLPKPIREALAAESRVITVANPVFMS